MLQADNKYTKMQKDFYATVENPMYNNDEKVSNFEGTKYLTKDLTGAALEFGCGLGRNIVLYKDQFKWIDGCDLNPIYIEKAKKVIKKHKLISKLYLTDGISLNGIPSDYYDVVFSITVLQHIPVHEIRYNIFKDIYRVLKQGGTFSAQMGFGDRGSSSSDYYENYYDAQGTNSRWDVRVDSPEQIEKDLIKIGFKDFEYQLVDKISETGDAHEKWIFFRGIK